MPPIPRVTGLAASYDNPPGTVSLSAATSTVGPSPTYQWVLVEYPPSLLTPPELTGANTATPVLTGVTERGTYIVFLKITDDTGSSHPAPYPTQAAVEPFDFTSPLSTAFGIVRVKEVSGLVKPGRGQYGWTEDFWALVDRAGNLFPYYNEATKELQANSVVPATGSSVTVRGDSVIVNGEASLQLKTEGGGEISIEADGNLSLSSSGDLILSNPSVIDTLYLNSIQSRLAAPILINGGAQNVELRSDERINLLSQDNLLFYVGAPLESPPLDTAGTRINIIASNPSGEANIGIQAGTDITVTALDDVSITASDELNLSAKSAQSKLELKTDVLLSSAGELDLRSTKTAGSVELIASGVGGTVKLSPESHTVTTKPVFAPGLAGTASVWRPTTTDPIPQNTSFELFSGDVTSENYTNAMRFTRHINGSELRVEFNVFGECLATTPTASTLNFVVESEGGVGEAIEFGILHTPALGFILIKADLRILVDSSYLAFILTMVTNEGAITTGTTHVVPTSDYLMISNMSAPIVVKAKYFAETGATVYLGASVVSSLYNPHNEVVL